eukprot:3889142-Lingulodinium_polyedra.AAC.1
MKRRSSFWGVGGKHQRLARAALTAGALASGSQDPIVPELFENKGPLEGYPEVEVLLELWSLGLVSAILLQTVAAAACR